MTNKIAMTKLEFMTFKSLRITYLVIFPLMLIFIFLNNGKSIIMPAVTCAWMIPLLSANLFVIQETNSLERLYSSLSIQIKDVVFGRYLYIFLTYLISLLILLVTFVGFCVIQSLPISFIDLLLGFSISFFLYSLVIGIELPIFFKMGYMKGKLFATIPYFGIFALTSIPALANILFTTMRYFMANTHISLVLAILLGCIIQYLSYSISKIAYRKKR